MSPMSSKHKRDYRECKKKKLVKRSKINIFDMEEGPGIETHPTGGARSCYHGINFERELTMLWTYRAYRSGKEYTVAIEDERTGKFDDFYINIKNDDGTILQQFVQLKHSSQKSPKLTNLDLFPSKSIPKNVFDLKLYFKSFLSIKNCSDFDLPDRSSERFILFTNRSLTFGGKIGEFEFCESMFKKERDTEILNTDIFKFKDEFPGRDSLKKLLSTNVNDLEYVDKFLQHFYIAENQPDGLKVSELLKSELVNDFNEIQCENAYNKFYVDYLGWYKERDGNKGTKLSHTVIKEYFTKIKHHVVKQTTFELMDPAANFYGREDIIAQIRKHLTIIPKSTSHVIDVSISGMSGVGKTEIAKYYARKYRDEYDYILWLNASSPQTLDASFERLNYFLNIKDNDKKHSNAKISEREVSQDRIKRIYSFLQNYACLIIFDSECDLLKQELINDMRQYLPLTKCNDHHFIVTTQIQNLPCNFDEYVDNFSQKETLGFLKQNLNSKLYNNDAELITLGYLLSNLSLALQIATSYIKENDRRYQISGKSYTVSNFLDEYQKESILVLNYKSKDLANKSLITLCELSIQSMLNSNEKARHLSLQILYIIAHLQPDHISIQIFDSKKQNTEDLLQDAILMLKNHSLITVSSGHISIHRLTQDILRAKLQQISEKEKNDYKSFFEVDKKGRLLHLDSKEMIERGNYNKEYILLLGLYMFQESLKSINFASNDEQIKTTNIIIRHSITFIGYCIENTYLVYAHLNFILYAFNFLNQFDECLECISCLKYFLNNLKHYTTENDMEIAKFLIKSVLTEKYQQVRDFYHGIKTALECQNILDHYKIPFEHVMQQSLNTITFLKNVGQEKESFELLWKLYILFDDFTNFQNHKLSHNEIKKARMLGILLQEHLKFKEALHLFETIRQQESYMCQNNLLPKKENCECEYIAVSVANLYCLQNNHFEAKEILLCAQKCIKVPSKHNELQQFFYFFRFLCYLYYQCGNTSNSLSVLNEISKIQFPALGVSDYTIRFKRMLSCLTANYSIIDKKYENAVDVLLSALYSLIVIYKRYNILNISKHIEFAINDVVFPKVSVTHSQASEFELLLFNLIYLSNIHFGLEYSFAKLLKIEISILEHFGHTTEIYSCILMCKSSLYKCEKKHTREIQTWIDILQLRYLLSKDSDSAFLMFRLTLNKFLNEKHLGNYFDLVSAEQLLCTVKMAINDIEKSLSLESKSGIVALKFQYFECLLLTKKYSLAEEWGLQFLSLNILILNRDINFICAVHVKLALNFYKIKKETLEAIDILNKCIQVLENMVFDSETNLFSIEMTNKLEINVKAINEKTVNELRIIHRVICCIEKSKIYYEIGEHSNGWDTLQDCMYKIHDFDVLNASFIPIIKEILLHLIEVGETEKALQYINDKCKLENNNLDVFGVCQLLRIKAKLQFKKEEKTDAIETLWKLWNQKLTIVSKTNIHSYRNIEFLDQIKNILRKLEYQLSWHIIDHGITKSAENLYNNEQGTLLKIELTFYIAFCNYLLGSYRECMRAIESVEKLLECCNFKNEELDNIAFDSSILKQRCNVCLNSL